MTSNLDSIQLTGTSENLGSERLAQRDAALTMTHDATYIQAKTTIMKSIDAFYAMLDVRTLTAIINAKNYAMILRVSCVSGFPLKGQGSVTRAVRICISDTDMGISADDLATLFQQFRQLDSGLARNHEGTGLGLTICRRLAELMGGEIGATSTLGQGSTFCFTLPLTGTPA